MDAYAEPELDSPDLHPSFTYPARRMPVVFTHKRFALLAGRTARALASLAGRHMTPARLDVLMKLFDGPLLQRDLCLELGVVPSVLSRILDGLERLGHVTRVKWEDDARFRMIAIAEGSQDLLTTLFDGIIADESLSGGIQAEAEGLLGAAWEEHFEREGISAALPFEGDKRDFLRKMTHTERQTRYVDEWFDVALTPADELVAPPEHISEAAEDLALAWRWMQRRWRRERARAKAQPGWHDERKTRSAPPEVLAHRRDGLVHDSTLPPFELRRTNASHVP